MAENRIKRRDLWSRLDSIKKKEAWIKASEKPGLKVTKPKGGSSHYAIRRPNYENWDVKGLISVVYDPMRKDISETVFKKLLDHGYHEDDIWRALGML